MSTSVVMIGMSLGSGMPGVIAAELVPTHGWESLFVVGAALPVFIAILLAIFLPESLQFLILRGRDRAQVEKRAKAIDPGLETTTGAVFGMVHTDVNPPAAAAAVPDAMVSL